MGLFSKSRIRRSAAGSPAADNGRGRPRRGDVGGRRRRRPAAAPRHAPPSAPRVDAPAVRPPQPSAQVYLQQLKVRIHQQLVERLDVQNLTTLPPDTVRAEVRVADPRAVPDRKGPAQRRRAGTADGRGDGRDLRPRPARDAAEGPDDHRHPGQPLRPHLRRAQGPARAARTCASATTRTCGRSSTASSARSAGASTRPARWSTPASPTAAASTRSSRRWRWTARRCRSADSAPSRCSSKT